MLKLEEYQLELVAARRRSKKKLLKLGQHQKLLVEASRISKRTC